MQYNTERERLIIPEYGRHVQEMVNHCKTIENKDDRNAFSQAIITVMGNLNTHLRDVNDFQHKLWDQLFIMADFDLDVDSPYPIPNSEDFTKPPNRIPYPVYNLKYKYYGQNIQRMIDFASAMEDGDKKDGLIQSIANQMKKSYLLWNKDTVDDKVIFNHLKEMSNGKINIFEKLDDINLSSSKDLTQSKPRSSYSKKRRSNRKKS